MGDEERADERQTVGAGKVMASLDEFWLWAERTYDRQFPSRSVRRASGALLCSLDDAYRALRDELATTADQKLRNATVRRYLVAWSTACAKEKS